MIEATGLQLLDTVAQPGDMFRLVGLQCSKLVDEVGVQGVLLSADNVWEPLHREEPDPQGAEKL